MVLHLESFFSEVDDLNRKGIDVEGRIKISVSCYTMC